MMDSKNNDLLRRKQDSKQMDGNFRNFVNEVSGYGKNGSSDVRSVKSRIIDEQNKMIDKQNLRK